MTKQQRYELTEKGRARKRRYREKKLAAGICAACTRPLERGTTHCRVHNAGKREWAFMNPT